LQPVDIMKIPKRNMKGFIFTLDAIFALVVAAVGVSILLYVDFTSPAAYGSAAYQASSVLQSMLQTTIGSAAGGSLYLSYLTTSSNASAYTWPQFAHDGSLGSGTGYSLQAPFLLYTYSTPADISPSVAVSDGVAAIPAGSKIYLINASTGKFISSIPSGSPSSIVGTPAISGGEIIYANATGNVVAASIYNGMQIWSIKPGNTITTPISIENNYVAFGTSHGFYLLNQLNGSQVAYAYLNQQTQLPLYIDGEYVASTTSLSQQNFLYSYSLVGNALVSTWNVPLASAQTTAPSSINNTIAVGSGDDVYFVTPGGSLIGGSITFLDSQVVGIGGYGSTYYVQTQQTLYAISDNTNVIFGYGNYPDMQNSTPTAGPGAVYTLINGESFLAYNTSQETSLWNITLPSNYLNRGNSNIALAYGNMYVPNGNTLYVFGTYKPLAGDSILKSLGEMYLNKQGGYSDVILQDLYNSSTTGIFINHTYAPSLSVATFNSPANSYIEQSDGFAWMNNPAIRFTMSVWINPTSTNGVVVDELGQSAPGGSWHNSILDLVNGNVVASLPGLACTNLGSVPQNQWSNIVLTWNSNDLVGYINGQVGNTVSGARSIPGGNSVMYYPLGIGDSNNCGSNAYFSGKMLDYQIYNKSLGKGQVGQIYHEGAFSDPINQSINVLWWPLAGNSNDFSGFFNFGIPYDMTYSQTNYIPQTLSNAYQVSKASVPMFLSSNGIYSKYNVSVVTWR
jgi:hypothetical protein